MVRLDGSRWTETARAYVAETQARAEITDTFPYGLREEWRAAPPGPPLIHIARRLLTPIPMSAEDFSLILQAEPLSEGHRTALGASIALPRPILLPPDRIATPIPAALDRDDLTLIVHSGPVEEVAALRELAESPYVVPSPLRRSTCASGTLLSRTRRWHCASRHRYTLACFRISASVISTPNPGLSPGYKNPSANLGDIACIMSFPGSPTPKLSASEQCAVASMKCSP